MLDLLDAQRQILAAQLTASDAKYGFLEDLIAAERAISFYAFLHEPGEVKALFGGLAQGLRLRP